MKNKDKDGKINREGEKKLLSKREISSDGKKREIIQIKFQARIRASMDCLSEQLRMFKYDFSQKLNSQFFLQFNKPEFKLKPKC